jgi:hypothetical protein
MAQSMCLNCKGHSFELVEQVPKLSRYKLLFVQCADCGAVVGVIEFLNIGDSIYRIGKKLGVDVTKD